MNVILKKLSSRKLWACIAGVVSGLALAFGLDGDTITGVSGAVVSLVSIITYILAEAKIDTAAVGKDQLNENHEKLDDQQELIGSDTDSAKE